LNYPPRRPGLKRQTMAISPASHISATRGSTVASKLSDMMWMMTGQGTSIR